MSYDGIGRRYARAIFELGKEEANLSHLAREISDIAASFESSSDLQNVLENPLVSEESRTSILAEVAQKSGVSDTVQRTLRVIAKHRRLRALPYIALHLNRLVDAEGNVVRATVISAAPLSESYLARLRGEIEKSVGGKVVIVHSVDPALIAGVVTKIGDRVVDGSARSRLQGLRSSVDTSAQ